MNYFEMGKAFQWLLASNYSEWRVSFTDMDVGCWLLFDIRTQSPIQIRAVDGGFEVDYPAVPGFEAATFHFAEGYQALAAAWEWCQAI